MEMGASEAWSGSFRFARTRHPAAGGTEGTPSALLMPLRWGNFSVSESSEFFANPNQQMYRPTQLFHVEQFQPSRADPRSHCRNEASPKLFHVEQFEILDPLSYCVACLAVARGGPGPTCRVGSRRRWRRCGRSSFWRGHREDGRGAASRHRGRCGGGGR